MPNRQPGPLKNKVLIFDTNGHAVTDLIGYASPNRVVAVLPSTTREDIAKLKAAGYSDVVLWDPEPSAGTADKAKQLGVDAVVLQVEGPAQKAGADSAASGLRGSGITIGVVSNNSAAYGSYVDVAYPEAYAGQNPHATPENVVGDAQRLGAPPAVYPVVGGEALANPADPLYGQMALRSVKYGGYGIYPPDPTNGIIMNPMLIPSQQQSSAPTQKPPTTNPTVNNKPSSHQARRGHFNSTAAVKPVNPHARVVGHPAVKKYPGITGPHQAAGASGAPKAYTGGANVVRDPAKTFSFTDKTGRRVTITTTASGAKIEQVAGRTPYQIKKPDLPPARTPVTDASKPAWHQNTAWAAPSANVAAKAHVDANTVLEQRPGASGNTLLRMADGTYKSYNPTTGQTTGAGTWNKSQWDSTHHGQNVNGGGGGNSNSGGGSPAGNDNTRTDTTTNAPASSQQPNHPWTQQDQFNTVLNRGLNGPSGGVTLAPYGGDTGQRVDATPDPGVTGLVGDSLPGGRGGV